MHCSVQCRSHLIFITDAKRRPWDLNLSVVKWCNFRTSPSLVSHHIIINGGSWIMPFSKSFRLEHHKAEWKDRDVPSKKKVFFYLILFFFKMLEFIIPLIVKCTGIIILELPIIINMWMTGCRVDSIGIMPILVVILISQPSFWRKLFWKTSLEPNQSILMELLLDYIDPVGAVEL